MSPFFRPIKYSLFPPLGLATLAAYLPSGRRGRDPGRARREAPLSTTPPTSSPSRSTSRPRGAPTPWPTTTAPAGAYVVLGGLHVTSLPEEAAAHADTIFLGPARTPGRSSWPTSAPAGRARATSSRVRTPGRAAPHPPRPHQALALPGAELDRGLARLPALLLVLLQGGLLRRRARVLHPARGRGPGRDRAPARPPPLLPGRPPLRRRALRVRALRRDARDGAALAGRGHGGVRPPPAPAREGGGLRAAQPLRRASRPSTRRTCARSASPRTCAATTARPSAACTASASWSTAASSSAWTRTTRACSTARSSGRSARASRPRPSTSSPPTRAR